MSIDGILFISAIIILIACLILSIRTRFIQFRLLPYMAKSLVRSLWGQVSSKEEDNKILPHKALFTAMSTTLGISTMISPVIAIHLGGPGALIGYLLTTILGSAATYTEVSLAVVHRKEHVSGKIMGGPMQYLERLLSPALAKWYAVFCLLLMCAWSGAQANQLAAILSSPLVGSFSIPAVVTGALLAFFVTIILLGGIKRIADFSAKLVPMMFTLYLGASFWIIFSNLEKMPDLIALVVKSALSPYELATGSVVGGIAGALRWGIFKGMHSNEAALGTQTIPNSMSQSDALHQGALSMVSTYSAGFVAILSGFVALITNTWQDPTLGLGIDMVAASYQMYFSTAGVAVVVICAALFGVGTALGNGFNGGHCFEYLTKNRFSSLYVLGSGLIIFLGAISEVTLFWAMSDIVLALVAVPHALSLVLISFKKSYTEETAELQRA